MNTELDWTDVFVFVAMIAFVLTIPFVLGLMVGRTYVCNQVAEVYDMQGYDYSGECYFEDEDGTLTPMPVYLGAE